MQKSFLKPPQNVSRLHVTVVIFIVLAFLFVPELAFAASDDALPYEEGLGKFQKSLKGPVPFAISLVGIVACGAMLIFGGEISGFLRTMVFIVLVVAVMVQATTLVEILGGTDTLVSSSDLSTPALTRDVA
ncbi:TrbC/VirB2 family protein [Luteibacter flocculans]|uniref:TrbC/VirB2 family protein n=1 Tax=Luteibacter flocculans TaxID=2780091 RepID=A0ABY4T2E7_9GAMM|nr:TrbC/VirB2 family protein [Luteibacter flocculans]URL58459.1 TrbC/VirB2 family protein [Luteibacter flocculans]